MQQRKPYNDKQSSRAKPVPTFSEQQLELVTKEASRDLDAAWSVINMFDKCEALKTQHPLLYLRAQKRIARNRNWYRAGRVLGTVCRFTRSIVGKAYCRIKQRADSKLMQEQLIAELKQQYEPAVIPTPAKRGVQRQRDEASRLTRFRVRAAQLKQRAVATQSDNFVPLGIS